MDRDLGAGAACPHDQCRKAAARDWAQLDALSLESVADHLPTRDRDRTASGGSAARGADARLPAPALACSVRVPTGSPTATVTSARVISAHTLPLPIPATALGEPALGTARVDEIGGGWTLDSADAVAVLEAVLVGEFGGMNALDSADAVAVLEAVWVDAIDGAGVPAGADDVEVCAGAVFAVGSVPLTLLEQAMRVIQASAARGGSVPGPGSVPNAALATPWVTKVHGGS